MKKGVVMEVEKRHMIVLTKNGEFIRARVKVNANIGEEVDYSPVPVYQFPHFFERKMYSVPLAFILTFLLIFPGSTILPSSTVHGFVSLDMNPSIELAVNDHYEILYTVGYNDKGKTLLEKIGTSLEGMTLVSATDILVEEGLNQGMIHRSHSIYISSAFSFSDKLWGEDFQGWSLDKTNEYDFDIYSILVHEDDVKEAQDMSLSPVKLLLTQEQDNMNINDISNTPIHELEKAVGQEIEDKADVETISNSSFDKDMNSNDQWENHSSLETEDQSGNANMDSGQNQSERNDLTLASEQAHPQKQVNSIKEKGLSGEKREDKSQRSKAEKNGDADKQPHNQAKGNSDKKNDSGGQTEKESGNKQGGKSDHTGKEKSENKQSGKPDHAAKEKPENKQSGKSDHTGKEKSENKQRGKPDHAGKEKSDDKQTGSSKKKENGRPH
ncbi:hypothetical protein CR194_03275 [Salipaludibacillus keqinensis]|uniref:RsgI N-terminal anti-sigma domain-containing protein n=1 Tax=Salipaludibacillus keqinensis TaxID=2045207 RepID=A0A323TIF4_9BACI|nr:anti-sigma factor domain-containing protein [Salipaludibacillus keqinensis]PYZ94569.1 hypothetical protein CR194_03275 [Salipaludibacillus keqinensis]